MTCNSVTIAARSGKSGKSENTFPDYRTSGWSGKSEYTLVFGLPDYLPHPDNQKRKVSPESTNHRKSTAKPPQSRLVPLPRHGRVQTEFLEFLIPEHCYPISNIFYEWHF
jgi:hypothetical protein